MDGRPTQHITDHQINSNIRKRLANNRFDSQGMTNKNTRIPSKADATYRPIEPNTKIMLEQW